MLRENSHLCPDFDYRAHYELNDLLDPLLTDYNVANYKILIQFPTKDFYVVIATIFGSFTTVLISFDQDLTFRSSRIIRNLSDTTRAIENSNFIICFTHPDDTGDQPHLFVDDKCFLYNLDTKSDVEIAFSDNNYFSHINASQIWSNKIISSIGRDKVGFVISSLAKIEWGPMEFVSHTQLDDIVDTCKLVNFDIPAHRNCYVNSYHVHGDFLYFIVQNATTVFDKLFVLDLTTMNISHVFQNEFLSSETRFLSTGPLISFSGQYCIVIGKYNVMNTLIIDLEQSVRNHELRSISKNFDIFNPWDKTFPTYIFHGLFISSPVSQIINIETEVDLSTSGYIINIIRNNFVIQKGQGLWIYQWMKRKQLPRAFFDVYVHFHSV